VWPSAVRHRAAPRPVWSLQFSGVGRDIRFLDDVSAEATVASSALDNASGGAGTSVVTARVHCPGVACGGCGVGFGPVPRPGRVIEGDTPMAYTFERVIVDDRVAQQERIAVAGLLGRLHRQHRVELRDRSSDLHHLVSRPAPHCV
jgi:hypothetical protein